MAQAGALTQVVGGRVSRKSAGKCLKLMKRGMEDKDEQECLGSGRQSRLKKN